MPSPGTTRGKAAKAAFVTAATTAPAFPWLNLYNGTAGLYVFIPMLIADAGKRLAGAGCVFAGNVADAAAYASIAATPLFALLLLFLLPAATAWLLLCEVRIQCRQWRRAMKAASLVVALANAAQAALSAMGAALIVAAFTLDGYDGDFSMAVDGALLALQFTVSATAATTTFRNRDKSRPQDSVDTDPPTPA